MPSKHRAWTGVLAAAVLLAAGPAALHAQQARSVAPDTLARGIHPVLVLPQGKAGDTVSVELHLRRVRLDSRLASYQGELGYDTASLAVVGGSLPAGVLGVWHEKEKGRVLFAGAAPDGVPDDAVLTLRFLLRRPPSPRTFRLSIAELIGTEGFENLTHDVVEHTPPVVIRRPAP